MLAVCQLAVYLAGAEVWLARSRLDMRLLAPLLYYQGADLAVHRASPDPELRYVLRPGAVFQPPGRPRVTINALGFRDKPRSRRKPQGVFRIVCLGASNAYGPRVADAQTYPAELEALLNAGRPGRYEVWNAGVSAYVMSQNVRQAQRLLERDSPDLLVFSLTNLGRRAFLLGQPIARFFDADPSLYRENLRFCWPAGFDWLGRWRLLRTAVIALNRLWPPPLTTGFPWVWKGVDPGAAPLRAFYLAHRARVRMVLMIYPGGRLPPEYAAVGMPVIELGRFLPARHAPDYDLLHPPAFVYRWYARELAKGLRRLGLLGPRPRPARA